MISKIRNSSQETKGVLILCLSALSFSLFSLFSKGLLKEHIPPFQMILVRSVLLLPVLMLWAIQRGQPIIGKKKLLLFIRGLAGTCGLFCFFFALKHLPLGDTVLIFQAHPLVVALLAPLILKEKNKPAHWILLILSFLGVSLVVGPTGAGSWEGRLSAFICCFIAGMIYILLRYLRRTEGSLTIAISFPAISCAICIPAFLLNSAGVDWPFLSGFHWVTPSTKGWILLVAMSMAALGGQVFLTFGLGKVPAARGTSISNLQIALAIVFGFVFFGEIPTWITVIGGVIIVASQVILGAMREK